MGAQKICCLKKNLNSLNKIEVEGLQKHPRLCVLCGCTPFSPPLPCRSNGLIVRPNEMSLTIHRTVKESILMRQSTFFVNECRRLLALQSPLFSTDPPFKILSVGRSYAALAANKTGSVAIAVNLRATKGRRLNA